MRALLVYAFALLIWPVVAFLLAGPRELPPHPKPVPPDRKSVV